VKLRQAKNCRVCKVVTERLNAFEGRKKGKGGNTLFGWGEKKEFGRGGSEIQGKFWVSRERAMSDSGEKGGGRMHDMKKSAYGHWLAKKDSKQDCFANSVKKEKSHRGAGKEGAYKGDYVKNLWRKVGAGGILDKLTPSSTQPLERGLRKWNIPMWDGQKDD